MTARITAVEPLGEFQAALASDDAFESWYGRTLPRVYSYLYSRCGNDPALAEELSQQTFFAAIDQRSRWLAAIHSIMMREQNELARIITLEHGKPLKESLAEVEYAAGFFIGGLQHHRTGAITKDHRNISSSR